MENIENGSISINMNDMPTGTPNIEQQDIFADIEENPGFHKKETPEKAPSLIKVIGIGGGGNNAVNHMYEQNINGVSFVVMNTDRQALNNSQVPNRVLIGQRGCRGE